MEGQGNVVVDGLVEYTPSQIEDLALRFLRSRVDVSRKIPVDVELLLEHIPDVRLEIIAGLRSQHGVEGCVCNEFMSKTLVLSDDCVADLNG